ncbi:MAG TPA: DUF5069 domain-containing protein [Candidatus Baltobacteraceae bacterium]
MDLTKEYPRSVHDTWHGIVQLGRTYDKAVALAHGNIGEYHYNCPMDQKVFAFLGIDHEEFLDIVKKNGDINSYVHDHVDKKSPAELEKWNREYVSTPPTGDSLNYMTELRNQIAPDRDDVTTWPDVLDLDEKRSVPQRVAV